jgi:hypothetical protein
LINYAHANLGSRFPFYWMLPELIQHHATNGPAAHWIITATIQDLQKYQPDFVLVDTSDYKNALQGYHFDYLHFFSQDPAFQKSWQSYHYVQTINFALSNAKQTLAVYALNNER